MPNVTYWSPKKTKRFCHTSQPIAEPELWGAVPKRPNSSRNRAQQHLQARRRKCLTSPTEALRKQRFCHTSQPIAERELWGAVPKRPNSSRNRAQQHLQAQRPKCLTSPTEARRKQRFCHTSQPIAEPELWGPVPKRPNSSRNRAQQHLQAQRPKCLTSPTEALTKRFCHTSQPIAEPELWGPVPKRPNPKCLTSPTEALRKQRDFATPASPSQNLSSEDRFRSAAAEPKVPNVTYWSPKKTKRFCHTSQPIAEPELWGAVPKRPNPKCLTSPTEALRKQRDFATPASSSQNLSSEDRFRNGRTQSA